MAKKNTQIDEEIIDLTELIETGPKSQGKAASSYAAAASPPADEDFESILAQTETAPPKRKVDPHETLDMSDMGGIDNLLESLDIPAQPRESPNQPESAEPAASAADDDLDSVLDDLLGNEKPAPRAAATPEPEAPPPTETEPLGNDLDDILASFDTAPESAPKATTPAPEPPGDSLPDLDADLDDILAEMEPPKPIPPEPEQAPLQEEPDAAPVQNAVESAQADQEIPAEADEIADEILEPAQGSAASLHEDAAQQHAENSMTAGEDPVVPGPPLDFGAVPESLDHPAAPAGSHILPTPQEENAPSLPVQTWAPDTIATLCRTLATGHGAQETLQEFSRELGEHSAHMEDMGSQVLQLSRRILACESKISSARARIAALEKGLENISALDDLLREGTTLNAGFMALISSAIANALQGFNFPAINSNEQNIHADLEKLDAGIWSADQRIEALEKALQRQQGLEDRLAALEKAFADLKKDSNPSQFEKLDAAARGANARILALEQEVEQMKSSAAKMMEKAAAATVARVLHEEISKLAQS